jgi:hypothetical protein
MIFFFVSFFFCVIVERIEESRCRARHRRKCL